MRIAFGLTTHKNQDQVRDLLDVLRPIGHVYLHHDANAPPLPTDITGHDGISKMERSPTYWGTFHMVEVVLEMMRLALADEQDHLILVSGQDLLVNGRGAIERVIRDGDFQLDGGPVRIPADHRFGYRYHRRWYFKPSPGHLAWMSYRVAARVRRRVPLYNFSARCPAFTGVSVV